MKFGPKPFWLSLLVIVLVGFFVTPVTWAATECDKDGDGFIVIPPAILALVAPGAPVYDADGSYSPAEWQERFNQYVKNQGSLTDEEKCMALNFKKGAEPRRCDEPVIASASGVYDPSKINTPVRGTQVNPQAFDVADNGIDENCDGKDAALLEGAGTAGKDVGGLVQKGITLLSRVVAAVSILIMIWGGVLYATAAGDEAKVSKARKAILGAVIGLVVGLLAPTIVNLIVANLA